jgi:hypothetical protein
VIRLRLFAVLLLAALASAWAPAAALAAAPTFGQPSAVAVLDQPLSFSSAISGDDIASVDVLVRLAGKEPAVILPAGPGDSPGTWQASAQVDIATSIECSCFADGQSAPNTKLEFQFRVHAADGSTTLGPLGQATVSDNRFTWQTLSDGLVVVHWYQGDRAFAQAASPTVPSTRPRSCSA